jgi:hypothetical protein
MNEFMIKEALEVRQMLEHGYDWILFGLVIFFYTIWIVCIERGVACSGKGGNRSGGVNA